jgi:hypothetical protein
MPREPGHSRRQAGRGIAVLPSAGWSGPSAQIVGEQVVS